MTQRWIILWKVTFSPLRIHHNMSATDKTDNLMLPLQESVVCLPNAIRCVSSPDMHGDLCPVKPGYVPILQNLPH